jgi:hypothetical protein
MSKHIPRDGVTLDDVHRFNGTTRVRGNTATDIIVGRGNVIRGINAT